MIIERIEMRNFLAYRDPGPLILDGIHVACIVGPNGAGKSSILDAITFSLWGKARSNSADDLIHQGQPDMRVALVFRQDGIRYRVIRQRKAGKRGSSLLELQSSSGTDDWQGLSGATIRETQAAIDNLLHLDFDTFTNSAMLAQGRADEFTTKTPSQRKQILTKILGLSIWEDYESHAKERASAAKSELAQLDSKLEEINRELDKQAEHEAKFVLTKSQASEIDLKLQAAEKEWASLGRSRDKLIDLMAQLDKLLINIKNLEGQIVDAERQREKAETQADEVAIRAALQEVNKQIKQLAPLETERDTLLEKRASLIEEIGSLKGTNQTLTPVAELLKERMATLGSAMEPICPTCGEPLTREHRTKVIAEIQAELDSLRKTYNENRVRIRKIDQEVDELDREKIELDVQLNKRPQLEKRAGELQATLDRAGEARERVHALTEQIKRWTDERATDNQEQDKLEVDLAEAKKLLSESVLTERDLEQLRQERRTADRQVGSAQQKLDALRDLKKDRKQQRVARDGTAEDLAIYDELRQAFGKTGIPAMIIETVVPEIERSANELLGRMTNGRMRVRVETQKEIKTGELREALDIVISDELGSRPYELYSGGESFRIDFALRIALSRLLARRAGAQLRSLFIDEGFGSQDTQGRDHLVAAINSIQDDFERILVITHIEELKEAFPDRIEIEKNIEGSRFAIA